MRRVLPFVFTLLATTAGAQPSSYRVPASQPHIAIVNPYRMYWVRGADTVGSRVSESSIEHQRWSASGSGLTIVVDQTHLDVTRRVTSDTFAIESDGRVSTINSRPPGLNGRVDLLLRLPHVPLRVGTTWADTMRHDAEGPVGRHRYDVRRAYEAKRELDTLGRHVLLVQATGHVDYRDGWWADSARGVAVWIDVNGPLTEQFYFDVRAGQLVARSWKMDLRGTGAIPDERGALDTLPAGLLSEEKQWLVDASIAGQVGRELPRGDTSITSSGRGRLLLHSVRRTADTLETGFARNDGMVGTARAEFSGGMPTRYAAQWTEGFNKAVEQRVVRDGSVLRVSGTRADTTVSIPTSAAWGIADYSMQELLVPVILALPADASPHPFAIYRPYARHWDTGTIVVRPIPDGRIAVLQLGTDKPQAMVITSSGDYLYGENSDPVGAERAPAPGTARRAQLEALMKRLRAGNGPSPNAGM
jgi:hypothetical protein